MELETEIYEEHKKSSLKSRLRHQEDIILKSKLWQNNVKNVWSRKKGITGFNQREDRTDESLDRASELITFFSRFNLINSETSFPAPSQAVIMSSFDPQLLCHISEVLLLHVCLLPNQEMLVLPLPQPPTCLSPGRHEDDETAEATEPEHDCRSKWCQPQNPKGLCRAVSLGLCCTSSTLTWLYYLVSSSTFWIEF